MILFFYLSFVSEWSKVHGVPFLFLLVSLIFGWCLLDVLLTGWFIVFYINELTFTVCLLFQVAIWVNINTLISFSRWFTKSDEVTFYFIFNLTLLLFHTFLSQESFSFHEEYIVLLDIHYPAFWKGSNNFLIGSCLKWCHVSSKSGIHDREQLDLKLLYSNLFSIMIQNSILNVFIYLIIVFLNSISEGHDYLINIHIECHVPIEGLLLSNRKRLLLLLLNIFLFLLLLISLFLG